MGQPIHPVFIILAIVGSWLLEKLDLWHPRRDR